MMKIDFLVGDNDYATEIHFTKALEFAFRQLGFQTRLFSIGEGQFYHAFYEMLRNPPDWSCSFSDISLNHVPLGSLWTIPHVTLCADPPIYFLHHFLAKNGSIGCVDEKDVLFAKSMGCRSAFFLPHAADSSCLMPVDTLRPFEVVFFGSCIDYEELANSWPVSEAELLHEASSLVLSDKGISIAEALCALGAGAEHFARLHDLVDRYTRGRDRVELIRSMQSHSVHIWGKGNWKKYFPHLPVHDPVDFTECLKIMSQSQLVLNSSPRFKSGAHERIFYALMCGAAVLSGQNSYLSSQLPEVLSYTFGQWHAPAKQSWQKCAFEGQKNVLDNHTWMHRAQKMAGIFAPK